MSSARILYVEDNEDVRDTMKMLLEHEGFQVTDVRSAEDALDQLTQGTFDLLLTDYQLPQEDASWLIATAKARACLRDTPVIVLSGAEGLTGLDGYRVLRKPIGQEALLAAFEEAMASRVAEPQPAVRQDADLRLILYISGESHASRKARRNLALALRDVPPERIELVVHDVTGGEGGWEAAAEEDRVVVLPTLVRRSPIPKVWIAGDLSNLALVREAIVQPSIR